jgi:tetratricopeptide (TPR) repeat protein
VKSAALLVVAGIAACGHARPAHPSFPDAPLQLRDDTDRDQAIDQLWVLPLGPARDGIRAEVAAALARRIDELVQDDQPLLAEELLFQLCSLWRDDPQTVGTGLAVHAPLVRRLRGVFAKSGAIEPTIATLALLSELEPAHRAQYLAELDEILAFADELAVAEHGPGGERNQPIRLLAPTALALPLPWLVDRYVDLLEARQAAVSEMIRKNGSPTIEILRMHPDLIHTAHRIANVLSRAGRADEIHAHLSKLAGIFGVDRELSTTAEDIAVAGKSEAYFELARQLHGDKNAPDAAAALGACLRGLARYPHDSSLFAAAAEHSATLGRIDQPIAFYEASIQYDTEIDPTIALRLGKLYAERIARLANGGRPTAAVGAWQDLARYTDSAAKRAPNDVWRQVAAIAETSLGRGLVSQGRLADGEHALVAALQRAPSIEAYETLTTIAMKTDRLALAKRYATDGLGMLAGESSGDRYHRAKLGRLAGDIARAGGRNHDAAQLYLDALRAWAQLGDDKHLPRTIAAERKLEFGRVEWYLGNTADAVELVQQAVDTDPDSASTCSTAVAFLLEIGRTTEALDTLHRTLGSSEIGELQKVYAALWIVGDARWRGEKPDRLATEYLATRHGDLWYEQLAEAATGRLDLPHLGAGAQTAARRAELAFYTAVLGLDTTASRPSRRSELRAVLDAGLVMDAEYDLARRYLATP